jgi:nitroimidazol reductase NimA-like FMN-containing flavoprotein (pyridoxamine 5'-phosphate oxidase superfamily)
MSRTDKEITSREEIEDILKRGRVCHLGLCDNGIPYVVPVNYGYADGFLYVHSAGKGKKVEILRSNNLVSFNVCVDECLMESATACNWTMKYCSVTGTGKAYLVESRDDKNEALRLIMSHYSAGEYQFDAAMVDKVLIIKVRVDELTGKKSV